MSEPQAPDQLYVEYAFIGPEHMYEEAKTSDIADVYIPSNAAYFHFCKFVHGMPVAVSPTYYLTSDFGTQAELKERFPELASQIDPWENDESFKRLVLHVNKDTPFMVIRFPDSPNSSMVWPIVDGVVLIDRETRDVLYSSISSTEATPPSPQPA